MMERVELKYLPFEFAGEVIKWSGDMKTEVRPENKPMWREENNISLICST